MKISTAKLKQLIREELFYRDFYRDAPINESVGGLPAEIPIVRIGSGHFGAAHIQAFEEGPDGKPLGFIALLNNDSTFTILEKTPKGHRGISTGTLSVENPGDYPAASTVIIDPGAKLAWAGTLRFSDLTPESIAKIGAPANRYATELQDKYVKLVEAELESQGLTYNERMPDNTTAKVPPALIEDILDKIRGPDLEYDSQAFNSIIRKVIENATGEPSFY
jgi:hypothetical protein